MEISLEVNDALVETLGVEGVKSKLTLFASRLETSIAAQEALAELATIDLTNDPQWQAARTLAWEEEKQHIIPSADV